MKEINILEIDNSAIRKQQIKRLARLKSNRNDQEVKQALDDLRNSCKNGNENGNGNGN